MSAKPTTLLTPEAARLLWSRFDVLAATHGLEGCRERLRSMADDLAKVRVRMAVVGEIKKGKSSFVNALLGVEALLPVATQVATSTVYEIVWGPRPRFQVFFKADSGGGHERVLEIEGERLAEYGTEYGNPGNRKGVSHIRLETPSSLLDSGMEIIDTPGLGGLFRKHAQATWRWLPQAHVVAFVVDSTQSPLTREEVDFLERIRVLKLPFFFVQTKIDSVKRELWTSWQRRNLEIISRHVGKHPRNIRYFPVSAQNKHLADRLRNDKLRQRSGFPLVAAFLEQVQLPALYALWSGRLLKEITPELLGLLRVLREQRRTEAAAIAQELDKAESDLHRYQRAFVTLKNREFPAALKELREELQVLISQTRFRLQRDLDPGAISAELDELIQQISAHPSSASRHLDDIQGQCRDLCARRAHEAVNDLYQQGRRLLVEHLNRLDSSALHTMWPRMQAPEFSFNWRDAEFRLTRTSVLEDTFRSGMAGFSVLLLTKSAVFLLPLTIPAAIFLSTRAWKSIAAGKREQVRRLLKQMVSDTARQASMDAQAAYDKQWRAFQRDCESSMASLLERHAGELARRQKAAAEVRGRSREQSKEHIAKLDSRLQELDTFHDQLRSALGFPARPG